MSFINTYGGNKETMAHSGMSAVQRAVDNGMTISQIQAQAAREGISFGSKAQDYINARKNTFIGKYGGNEGTMAHAGIQAVNAASAAGLSFDQMRKQAAAEGVQFQSGAQAMFAQSDGMKAQAANIKEMEQRYATQTADLQSKFDLQMSGIQSQMKSQQASYDSNLKSMENTLKATMQPNNRESVLGIKGASGGTSEAMTRQGIKGTFGRSGMRIKKIKDKALNVT